MRWTEAALTHLSAPSFQIWNASIISCSRCILALPKIVTLSNRGIQPHNLQCKSKLPPVPEGRRLSCSLNWTLTHRPDCPMQSSSQFKGMPYTTYVLHAQYFFTCFMSHILLIVLSCTTLLQRPVSLLGAEQTSLTSILAAAFFILGEMSCTYCITTIFFCSRTPLSFQCSPIPLSLLCFTLRRLNPYLATEVFNNFR